MTQTNTEQWAVELWRKACHDYGGMSIEGGWGEQDAALAIQAAFSEREARLRDVLETLRDYVSDTAQGALTYEGGGEGLIAMAKEDLARIDATLAALKDRTNG